MMTTPAIYIGDQCGPVLIVEHASGVRYGGQVGGTAMFHRYVEGVLLLLPTWAWEPLLGISHPDACAGEPISPELAGRLEAAWPSMGGPESGVGIALDRSRLDQGTEAWFPVVLSNQTGPGEESPLAEWLDGRRGWLLMPDNCD